MFAAYHKAIVRRFFAQVLNGRDRAAVGGGVPPRDPGRPIRARRAHRRGRSGRGLLDRARDARRCGARSTTPRAATTCITGVYVFRLADGAIVGLWPHTRWPEDTDRRDAQN